MLSKNDIRNLLLITLGAIVLFIPFLGSVHLFDWDEINFAECAREMVSTGDYSRVQLNFQPFWEKPPFFIWLQAISMNIFGINEFAARFPNAICGIVTLNIIYLIGKTVYNGRFGLWWVLVYTGTFLSHFYFKSGIIDPWFNLFIFIGIYYAVLHTNNPTGRDGYRTAALSGAFIGLAILTKGPAGLLIFGLAAGVFWISTRFAKISSFRFLLTFCIALGITGFSWFFVMLLKGQSEVIREFFIYQVRLFNTKDSGHGGFLLYHFVILLAGCFPSSVFFLLSHKKSSTDTPFQKHFKRWMLVLFWVVLILFTIVKTKIVHYSSMCWLPLTFLATWSIHKLMSGELKWKKWMSALFVFLTVLLGAVFTVIPLIDQLKPFLLKPGVINDEFARENLSANVKWLGFEWLLGVAFILLLLYFLFRISKQHFKQIAGIYLTCLVTINLIALLFVPKIEQYSQGAAIEFYESIRNKPYYVETFGFKSYAYLFYTNKLKDLNSPPILAFAKKRGEQEAREGLYEPALSFNRYAMDWMMNEAVDKPVYIVAKINDANIIKENNPRLKEIYRKNGFVFYKRIDGER